MKGCFWKKDKMNEGNIQKKVNFNVIDCILDVTPSFNENEPKLTIKMVLKFKKSEQNVSEDYWVINEWDASIQIKNLHVVNQSEQIRCTQPKEEDIRRGRKSHKIYLTTEEGKSLPVSTETLTLELSYEKPLIKGLNYNIFSFLPSFNMAIINDPVQLFNPCKHLLYHFHLPKEWDIYQGMDMKMKVKSFLFFHGMT